MFEKDLDKFNSVKFRYEFLARVYEGFNLVETCALMKVNPAALGIYKRDDPEFDNNIKQARAFRVDLMTEKLENIQDYEDNAMMASVISKNIQFLAAKRYREIYGDKVDVQHNVVINIKEAMELARARTIEFIDANPLKQLTSTTDNISVNRPVIDVIETDDDPLAY